MSDFESAVSDVTVDAAVVEVQELVARQCAGLGIDEDIAPFVLISECRLDGPVFFNVKAEPSALDQFKIGCIATCVDAVEFFFGGFAFRLNVEDCVEGVPLAQSPDSVECVWLIRCRRVLPNDDAVDSSYSFELSCWFADVVRRGGVVSLGEWGDISDVAAVDLPVAAQAALTGVGLCRFVNDDEWRELDAVDNIHDRAGFFGHLFSEVVISRAESFFDSLGDS